MRNLTKIQEELIALGDAEYKAFHSKLIPNIPSEKIIGVRTPTLRKYAKTLAGSAGGNAFLKTLPHYFYEENNLHAFILEQINNYDELVFELDRFLPHVDNWATCDMMSPKCFKKHTDKLFLEAYRWFDSRETYKIRFGICVMMKYYLGENLKQEFLQKIAAVKSDEYYVKMAVAWYFATALTKNYEETLPYIENNVLDKWTHNKAIQKACESYQVPQAHKAYLKTLK